MKSNSAIDNAIVFNTEISEIEKHSGVKREEFLQDRRYPKDGPYQTLKHVGHSGCYFYENGKCLIYNVRPLICALFPFDFRFNEAGSLFWVVYQNLCPVYFNYKRHFSQIKKMALNLDMDKKTIVDYLEENAPSMKKESVLFLEEFEQP